MDTRQKDREKAQRLRDAYAAERHAAVRTQGCGYGGSKGECVCKGRAAAKGAVPRTEGKSGTVRRTERARYCAYRRARSKNETGGAEYGVCKGMGADGGGCLQPADNTAAMEIYNSCI